MWKYEGLIDGWYNADIDEFVSYIEVSRLHPGKKITTEMLDSTAANRTRPSDTSWPYQAPKTITVSPDDPLPWNATINNNPPEAGTDYSQTFNDTLRTQRRKEGRCEECGELRPMTAFGLGDCKFKLQGVHS